LKTKFFYKTYFRPLCIITKKSENKNNCYSIETEKNIGGAIILWRSVRDDAMEKFRGWEIKSISFNQID